MDLRSRTFWTAASRGCVDPDDDDPLAAARRELAEETGCTAASWRHLAALEAANAASDHLVHLFEATDLTLGPARPEATEDLRVRWMSLADAVAAVRAGTIREAGTIAALLLAT